jgi:predicted membrane metal-binding protein
MTLLLMPLQVLSFHGLSLSSMAANLIAVPLVTFITVPLVLFGMLLHLIGPQSVESLSGIWLMVLLRFCSGFCNACRTAGLMWMHAGLG